MAERRGRLEGRIAIVTGGASGIGKATVMAFAREGANVVVTDVDDEGGQQVAAQSGGHFLHQDVINEREWASVSSSVMNTHGRVDVLVNNAGLSRPMPMFDTSLAEYLDIIGVNQTGVFLGMRDIARVMFPRKTGSIINISSVAGLGGQPNRIAYGAAKWAVRGMTKVAAVELAAHGIRVNSIHPGIIDTPFVRGRDRRTAARKAASRAAGTLPSAVRRRLQRGNEWPNDLVPLQRIGQPEEVANLAVFLASDESAYCTGTEFVADGGFTLTPD